MIKLTENIIMKTYKSLLLLVSLLLTGCASSNSCTVSSTNCHDPLEHFNRTMFSFNLDVLDPYIVRPAAVFWKNYVPIPLRKGLHNFSSNLVEPASAVNSLLVGNVKLAFIHLTRFFLNSTIGVGGLMDVASLADRQLRVDEQRFGSVLGRYNVPYGPYVMLPAYGSFTLREEGGKWVDALYPMLSYLTFWTSAAKWALDGLETRATLLDNENLLKNANDPYRFMFEAYFQHNNFKANGGVTSTSLIDNKEMDQLFDEIDANE